MKKTPLQLANELCRKTQRHYESSTGRTPEYRSWHSLFRRHLTAIVTSLGGSKVEVSKPNHFDGTAFFTGPDGRFWYVSIGDIRWLKRDMLIRTVQSYKDYHGGHNQYVNIEEGEAFLDGLKRVITPR